MKKDLHPQMYDTTARCACGNSFQTRSTQQDIRTTICSNCHPVFTGAQKFVDTAGRIEKFEQRYKKFQAGPAQAPEKKAEKKSKKQAK